MATTATPQTDRRGLFMGKTLGIFMALLLAMGTLAPGAGAFGKDSLTYKKCVTCHEAKGGKTSRVEEIRTTPEEWTVIVDRMARLYGMELKKGEMAQLLKELCSTQSLSPEEADQVAYLNLYNNPQTVEAAKDTDPEKMFVTCVRCHSAGKIKSYRMTESAWKKLLDLHLYTTPTVVFQMREMRWIPEAEGVLAQLAKSQPYGQAWQAPKVTPVGSWMVLGYEPGKGNYRGQATVATASGGDFQLSGNLTYADGSSDSFRGEATLYGGHALRTRTTHNGFKTIGAYTFANGLLKGEHHFPAPDFRTSASSWYPLTDKAQVLRITPAYLLSGETTTLVLEGMNLPQVAAADLQVAGGEVEILSAKRLSAEVIEAQVTYRGKEVKQAKLNLKGLEAGPLTLAPQIDYIAVTPPLGRARVSGGQHFPAEGVQFEAIAYSKGADAASPADDLLLGPVPASFKLSEEVTRPGDDDLFWLGAIEADGTYLPIGDYGPIPAREYQGEGTGLVKVEADYTRGGRTYAAHGRLVVTVPDYIPRIK